MADHNSPNHVHTAACTHARAVPTTDPPTVLPKRDIGKVRLERELEVLSRAGRFEYDHYPKEYYIVINRIIRIDYGRHFPFEPPKMQLLMDKDPKYEEHVCQFDLKRLKLVDIIGEEYHPSLNFNFLSEKAMVFLDQNVILGSNIDSLSTT